MNLLTSEQASEAHRARNPAGYVPALEIDGRSFAESVAIIEYLDETHPEPPLLPKDPVGRARVRSLARLTIHPPAWFAPRHTPPTPPVPPLSSISSFTSRPYWIAVGLMNCQNPSAPAGETR